MNSSVLALCVLLALTSVVFSQKLEYNATYVPGEGKGKLSLVAACGCCGVTIRCYRNNGEFATDFNSRKELPNKLNVEAAQESNDLAPAAQDAKVYLRCGGCCGWSIYCWYQTCLSLKAWTNGTFLYSSSKKLFFYLVKSKILQLNQ